MAPTLNLCQNCHVRPQYYDAATGKLHVFCSKGCAKTSAPANSDDNCEYCNSRPKYREGTRVHPFCGKKCAQASVSGGSPGQQQRSASPVCSNLCSTPGCSKQVYKDANGKESKYCGRRHKGWAEKGCVNCQKAQKMPKSHLCQQCQASVQASAPMILEISEEHETFQSVASQFEKSWRHKTPCPTVRAVYKIISSQQDLDNYETYRSSVEAQGRFVKTNRSAGNEHRRWHGTIRQCTLGDKGCTQFCAAQTCSLCCIIRTSFDLSSFGKNTGWGRYGTGIYTSSTSSKSNDYSKNQAAAAQSPWKAILLNKVVVGRGYKLTQNSDKMTAPPAGYDSVLAEVGGVLNYDELVVYNNDAVRPSYLVMFDDP